MTIAPEKQEMPMSTEELHERMFANNLKACIDGELDVPVSRLVADEVLRKLPYIGEQALSAADVIAVATCTADIVVMNQELQKLAVARRARIYVNTLDRLASASDESVFDGNRRRHDLIGSAVKIMFEHKYYPSQRQRRTSKRGIL